jgi:phosphate transport system permease protein
MTDPTIPSRSATAQAVKAGLRRRYAAERRFKAYGIAAIGVALLMLAIMFGTIISNGWSAFRQTYVQMDVLVDAAEIDPDGNRDPAVLSRANYEGLIKTALREMFPDVKKRKEKRELYDLVSSGATFDLRDEVMADPALVGQTVSLWAHASDDVDMYMKGYISAALAEDERRVSDKQIARIESLRAQGRLLIGFNLQFFTGGDSREPELAGIAGAALGSPWTMLAVLVMAFPMGVMAAIYLEEFAPKNRWTDIIEVNINNLAAVPSIVFGLLGLAVFLNFFGMPRSAPLVGGLVLALMTLPTIIIAGRAALKAVPPSIREGALGLGASRMQMVAGNVLPLAMPGMLTGAIIGMARALGETAPLLMIGMVAFIVDLPKSPLDAATALPVQIFLWADSPERAFVERTSAATIVLLVFLILMNLGAVLLRKKFERRW